MDRVFIPDMTMSKELIAPVQITAGSRLVEIVVDELL